MSAYTLRLPDDLEAQLEAEARAEGRPKSEVARRALAEWLAAQEKKRLIEAMVRAAKALYADPESRAEMKGMAEEGLEDWFESLEREERAAGIDPNEKWWD